MFTRWNTLPPLKDTGRSIVIDMKGSPRSSKLKKKNLTVTVKSPIYRTHAKSIPGTTLRKCGHGLTGAWQPGEGLSFPCGPFCARLPRWH